MPFVFPMASISENSFFEHCLLSLVLHGGGYQQYGGITQPQ